MPDDRHAEATMGAYWNALTRGDETADIGLAPDQADTILRLQGAGTAPPPPGARDRVWRRLNEESLDRAGGRGAADLAAAAVGPRPLAPVALPNGRRPASRGDERGTLRMRHFGRWMTTLLPTAAILLLTLVMGVSARWPGTFVRERTALQPPAIVRAIDAVPGDGVAELLSETTFAGEELPAGETQVIVYRITLPSDVDLPYLAGPFCALRSERVTGGVGTEIVQSGAYSLVLDTPMRVQRGEGSRPIEDIPAGTEAIIRPGDTAIFPDYLVEGSIRSAGDEPVVIVGVAILTIDGWGSPAPELPKGVRAEQIARSMSSDWPTLPAGPKTVAVWQLTLPEETGIGPYEPTGLEAMHVERGVITLGFVQPGQSEPFHLPMSHMAGTSVPFLRPSSDVRRTITSVGDEPAVLLAVSIEPAGAASGTLAP